MILPVTIEDILKANVYQIAEMTPIHPAKKLSHILQNTVLLKREDLQGVFSFKCRGACNKIYSLTPEEMRRGIIAASAGNHAQGVAAAAQTQSITATIVMPRTTPTIKVSSVQTLGATVILHGDRYDDAYEHAIQLSQSQQMTFIHPYDDAQVIAGQGTVAMEICRQLNGQFDYIFVPVGGGGLISGVAAWIKTLYPHIKIIGVEPENSACLTQALNDGKRSILPFVGIFADGVAVKQIGELPFQIARHCVDDMVTVSIDEICSSIKDIFEDTRTVVEPSGALAVAGIKKYIAQHSLNDQTVVGINSGANLNFDRLRYIVERSSIGEDKETILSVKIPEQRGAFETFCKIISQHSITELNYRCGHPDYAHILLSVELKDGNKEKNDIIDHLKQQQYQVHDLTDNEAAKSHIRHMIGGVPSQPLEDERLFRFQFPERPGALLDFLSAMQGQWSISLFHYRNHGASFGRVLVGIQVPSSTEPIFKTFLSEIQYQYFEETDNLAYHHFLK